MRQVLLTRTRRPREDPGEDELLLVFAENEASKAAERWLREHPAEP